MYFDIQWMDVKTAFLAFKSHAGASYNMMMIENMNPWNIV